MCYFSRLHNLLIAPPRLLFQMKVTRLNNDLITAMAVALHGSQAQNVSFLKIIGVKSDSTQKDRMEMLEARLRHADEAKDATAIAQATALSRVEGYEASSYVTSGVIGIIILFKRNE